MKFRFFIPLIILLTTCKTPYCQSSILTKLFTVPYDTNYISTYVSDYTVRIFSALKYSQMGYNDDLVGKSLIYKPGNRSLFGVGVNHGFLGINIGFGIPSLQQDKSIYGETKYYDLTMRLFSPRFNTTVYLQHYNGFYLRNTKDMIPEWENGDPYYIRGDMSTYTAGLEVSYIFNASKFSCRAAVLQNEWQKKSAGSFLAGISLFYTLNSGDSSIVPTNPYYNLFFDSLKFNRSTNLSLGPTFGYAYTFVIKKHFFILGSLNGSVNMGFTQLYLVQNEDKVKSGIVAGLRADIMLSAGYNSDRWYVGVAFFDLTLLTQAPLKDRTVSYETGMARINLVRRFHTCKPIKILNPSHSH